MHSGDMRHVRILANLFKRASRSRLLLGRDGVRLPLQTVGAVLLAYAWMTWQRMPDVAWARSRPCSWCGPPSKAR